jgi:hypothetical protein
MNELDKVLMLEEVFTDKQLTTLRDMVSHYKEFEEELYNYPEPDSLFTQTQRELFSLLDIV